MSSRQRQGKEAHKSAGVQSSEPTSSSAAPTAVRQTAKVLAAALSSDRFNDTVADPRVSSALSFFLAHGNLPRVHWVLASGQGKSLLSREAETPIFKCLWCPCGMSMWVKTPRNLKARFNDCTCFLRRQREDSFTREVTALICLSS